MLHPVGKRAACTWMVLLALALPFVADALPRCEDEGMSGRADGVTRCAGLWGAACCDFNAPRPRLEDSIEPPAAVVGLHVSPGVLYVSPDPPLPEIPDPEHVPIGLTTGSGAGPILSSTVLRL